MRHFPFSMLAAFVLAACPAVLPAQQTPLLSAPPAVEPRAWRAELTSPPNIILNMGMAHLSGLSEHMTRSDLGPLIDKLQAFRPDIITYEGLSGEQCGLISANPAIYVDVASQYCNDPAEAERATGMHVGAARVAVENLLANWPAVPTPAQRRHLASLFYAANDRPSAYVQWLQLPEDERHIGDGVDETLVGLMTRTGRMNENYEVAAVVAARLGLQRIYAIDDHTADAAIPQRDMAALETALGRLWSAPENAANRATDAAQLARIGQGGNQGDGALDYFRWINQPETLRNALDIDHHAAVRAAQDGLVIRRYVGWWETRNLRMVANIRATMVGHPGARVLNIVGASHKPYFDSYLGMMVDCDIVDAMTILR